MLLDLMGRYLKKEVLESAKTFKKLCNFDPTDQINQKHSKHADVGFTARDFVPKSNPKQICESVVCPIFKNDCVKFISGILIKLLKKFSLKYPLVQCLVRILEWYLLDIIKRFKLHKILE